MSQEEAAPLAPVDRRVFALAVAVFALLMAVIATNQEYDGHIYICTAPRHPWSALWLTFRSYS